MAFNYLKRLLFPIKRTIILKAFFTTLGIRMKNKFIKYIINIIFPAIVLGSGTGILTGAIITIYKFCAKHIIHFSETAYSYVKNAWYLIPVVLVGLLGLAFLFKYLYKKIPRLKGGGIPSSIALLRGLITFKWLRVLIGVFFTSLATFLVGVPLGNEGPSVLMGATIGKGVASPLQNKHRAWSRYSITGGACAGFAVATGAPVSGIIFSLEEAEHHLSPMILLVSCFSVLFARITTELLAPLLGVSISLFPELQLITLSLKDIWLPIVIGLSMGGFSVLFLYLYKFISKLFNKHLKKIPLQYKIFFVFAVTFGIGLYSFNFISTGHELILSLFSKRLPFFFLLAILLVRSILTLCSNSNKITGGMFLPILALGAVLSSAMANVLEKLGLSPEYYTIILVLGITACIAGAMKMPLTAIIFSVEALSCYQNIIYVVIVAVTSYVIPQLFRMKSINDSVIDNLVKEKNEGLTPIVIDTFVTVKPDSFAVGKQVRDILWPANLFVLSFKPSEKRTALIDEHGGKSLHEGDVLHVRYLTYDEAITKRDLTAIVGDQDYEEHVTSKI